MKTLGTYPLGPLSPFVRVEVTARATATIDVPGADGLDVEFDATSGLISVAGAGISFTDPGTVGLAAKRFAHDPSEVLRLLTSRAKPTNPLGTPLNMHVQVFDATQRATVGDVTEAVSLTNDGSDPAISIDTSADFQVSLGGHPATVKYGIVTDLTLKGQLPFHGLPVEAIQAMLFAAAGYLIPAGAAAFLRRYQNTVDVPRGATL